MTVSRSVGHPLSFSSSLKINLYNKLKETSDQRKVAEKIGAIVGNTIVGLGLFMWCISHTPNYSVVVDGRNYVDLHWLLRDGLTFFLIMGMSSSLGRNMAFGIHDTYQIIKVVKKTIQDQRNQQTYEDNTPDTVLQQCSDTTSQQALLTPTNIPIPDQGLDEKMPV